MTKRLLSYSFKKSLPVLAGYMVMGMAFGILLKVKGLGVVWAFLMSVTIYAGSMQFAGVGLLSGAVTLPEVALTTLLVNARHLFYGISMIEKYKNTGFKKPYLIHALTDETYSLVCSEDVPRDICPHKYYMTISLLNHCYWVTGSVLGSLAGGLLHFDTNGIEFAMTALFVTVVVDQWMEFKTHIPALMGIGVTLLCLIAFGKEIFLIPAMAIIVAGLLVFKTPLERGFNHE